MKIAALTLGDFINNTWLPDFVEDGEHKPSTISFYRFMIPRIESLLGNKDIKSINEKDIKEFLKQLRNTPQKDGKSPLSDSTIRHYFNTLRTILNSAYQLGLIKRNPMDRMRPPKLARKEVEALSASEIKVLIENFEKCSLDFRCMLYLFLTTGLRRGECMGLQWRDFDFSEQVVHVQRAVTRSTGNGLKVDLPKTQNSTRSIPLSEKTCELLQTYKVEYQKERYPFDNLDKAFVFPGSSGVFTPRDPTTVTRKVRDFMVRCNLPPYSPHDLRHTCASQMIANNADVKSVQNIMGHSNPNTTLKYYVKANMKQMSMASQKFTNAFGL